MSRTLLIPVETVAREFDGKLLLALTACARGWNVILGSQKAIRLRYDSLPKGVYLSKSARRDNNEYFAMMRAYGHRIAVLDEEVLVREGDDIFSMKHETDAFKNVDLVLTWGNDSKKFLEKVPQLKNMEIVATGNPRIDMLSEGLREYHSENIEAIKSQHGDYVLFNSNFSNVNHFIPGHTRFKLASWVPKAEQAEIFSDLKSRKISLMNSFAGLLPELARTIAPRKLIVRPHPSEGDEIWKRALEGNQNTAVLFEGSVVPWLLGADVVVHSGCTTALEATIVGVPCVSLFPFSEQHLTLPDALSLRASTADDVIKTVDQLLHGRLDFDPASPANQRTIGDCICRDPVEASCGRILEQLEKKFYGPHFVWSEGKSLPARQKVLPFLKESAEQLFLKTNWGKIDRSYRMRKFPELETDFVQNKIGLFQRVLNDFHNVELEQVNMNLFSLK